MPRSRKTELLKIKGFLNRLEATIGTLPTETEKDEVKARIATLVDYLNAVSEAFQLLPSQETTSGLNETIERLRMLMAKAEENPVLSGLAPRKRRRPKKGKGPLTDSEMEIAKTDVESFQTLPVDQIRNRLLAEGMYSMARLRAIAAVLDIATTDKMTRESLAHQVATSIANLRGYKKLGGDSMPNTK